MNTARVAALAAVALASAALPASAAAPEAAPPGITVVGTGFVRARPDTAHFSLGVSSRARTASAALRANAARMARVVAVLRRAGVPARALQTENLSLDRVIQRKPRFTGFRAANTVRVRTRALARIGSMLDAAVSSGANQFYGIEFSVANATRLYRRALDQALANARRKAQRMARALGTDLGRATSIVEAGTFRPGETQSSPYSLGGEALRAPLAPVLTGEKVVQAAVTVTFVIR